MNQPEVVIPATGSRIVQDDSHVVLFAQPPEVLKGLLLHGITHFDTLVLPDIKEKDGSLLNNLEFPFYFFLFVANGLAEGRKLNIVGSRADLSQAMRLLRYTLLGPVEAELSVWETEPELRQEWLKVSEKLALADPEGQPIPVDQFFNLVPFEKDEANLGDITIRHTGVDCYEFCNGKGSATVDLNEDQEIDPTYRVQADYVPGGLVKMGLEVLGGASGFTLDEPCTGLALCYNGDYMLIDALPFLDQNLFARGIAKNQISAVFLTHLHDDHCAMFPLMMMPHKVEVITTREIYWMSIEKLACNLGWDPAVIAEHFRLIEIRPGETLNYFGLSIKAHVTVHSIPTVGATFTTRHRGRDRTLCVVGDNHSMNMIRELNEQGIVRDSTRANLEGLYRNQYDLLVADGGAGAIHGDPADSMGSDADRVVFVHVDELSTEFNTTFSLASSGKRYTILEGDKSLYTSQVNHHLTSWLGRPFPNRWMRSLLADEEIRRYNQGDVIIVQDSETRGSVFLVLTGYCDVIHHDGKKSNIVANLQAGDIIGEMAVITGTGIRNASVVAKTPVTVCVFSEEIFGSFIRSEGFGDRLLERWSLRPALKHLPQFQGLSSNSLERIGTIARFEFLDAGDTRRFDEDHWYILADGEALDDGDPVSSASEFGSRPFMEASIGPVECVTDCRFIKFRRDAFERLRLDLPQLNYMLRKFRITQGHEADWLLGEVEMNAPAKLISPV